MTNRDMSENSFLTVGIGASAGGMEPLERFLSSLPSDFRFVLVFVQHLSAKHKSLLPELLSARIPSLVVQEISEGQQALPGRLYLAPPGKEVRLKGGVFHLTVHPEGLIHLPIDEFLISLAEDAGERAVGVIFSGAGTDGARGCRAVRDSGGTIYVQDPATAEFASMPLAVISTGEADAVLPPEEIAREIQKIEAGGAAAPDQTITPEEYDSFFRVLFEKAGARFNHYKKSVIGRRIRRRMYLHGLSSVREYLDLVAARDSEAASLASDLMIGVTSFFRDRVAWKALNVEVVRKIAAEDSDQPVRVWTPASSTGEEAYSITMMLSHELSLAGRAREVQVFATDVNGASLERARDGKYPASISADVPREYIQKYFTSADDGQFQVVSKEIRERVVFARQDLLTDPPFSKLDLIICRNFLIYLEPQAQEKCITLFHYALREGGYLFLGNAETVGRKSKLFKTVGHKQCRVYRKLVTGSATRLPVSIPYVPERTPSPPLRPGAEGRQQIIGLVQEFLLDRFAPAAIAVDHAFDIVYHTGPTNLYLSSPRGVPTQNALELLPGRIRNRVRGALFRAGKEGTPVSIRADMAGDGDSGRPVTLRIEKVKDGLFAIAFQESDGLAVEAEPPSPERGRVEEAAIHHLESELSATRQDLQSHIEQLKSLNEELQASNEELQAANEELETSREELQSLNEELVTVNSQLQGKIEEQEETNNDLNNFLASTNIPTMFLDHHLRVKRFTPAMLRLIQLLPSDVGRPIADMSGENLGPDLISGARTVLEGLVPVRQELLINGSWYLRAIQPYRTSDSRIEGVVVTYNDVTELKSAEERTRHLASFPQFNPNPVLEVNAAGAITYSNAATQRVLEGLGINKDDASLFLPHDIDGLLKDLDKKIEDAFTREVTVAGRVFRETIYVAPQFSTVRIYAFDVTERKRTERVLEARLRLADAAYQEALSASEVLRLTLDELEGQTGSKIGFYHFLEEDQETLSLQSWSTNTVATMCTAEGAGSHYNISQAGVWVDCVRERRPVIHNDYASLPHTKGLPKGHAPVTREMVIPIFRGERIVAIIGVGNKETDYTAIDIEVAQLLGNFSWEIVERKRAEEALRKSEEQFRTLADSIPNLAWWANGDGYITWYNQRWYEYTGTTPEQMEGWGWQSVHDPEALPKVLERWKASISTGEPFDMEFPLRGADGIFRSFLTRVLPLKDSAGSVLRWFGTNTDISALKRAEEALRESEERLRLAQQAGKVGSFEWNMQTGVNVWTPELEAMYGLSPGEFGRTQPAFEDLVHPDDRARVIRHNDRAIETGEPAEGEWRTVWPDGSIHWLAGRWQVFKDGSGKPLRMTGVNIDITERKKAEEALRESEERFRLMGETVPYGAWMADAQGRNTYISPLFLKLVGRTFDQVKEFGWMDKMPPEDVEPVTQRWMECVRTGNDWEGELRFLLPDGRVNTILSRGKPLRNPQGQIVAWVGINLDITERKKAEEALRESEEQFRRAIEDAPIPVIMHAEDGQVLQISSSWTELTGYQLSDLPTLDAWLNNAYGDGADLVREHVRALFEGDRRTIDIEFPIRTKDGAIRHWSFSASSPGVLHDGRRFVVGMAVDITERKNAEADLVRAKEEWERTFASVPDMIAIIDTNHTIMRVNTAMAKRLGRTPEECVGLKCYETVHGSSVPHAFCPHDLTIKDNQEHVREIREKRLDMDLLITTTPLFDEKGELVGSVHVAHDITERKKAEEELRLSEEKFATAFAANPAAIAMTRLEDGVFLEVNDTWLAMNGYDREEVIGRSARKLPIWPSAEAAARFIRELREKGDIRGWEQEFLRKSGEVLTTQLSAQVLTVRGEEVVLSTLVDITERKRAEEALKESESRYHSLFENMIEGFAYCKMLYDDSGQPVDFLYLEVNNAFARLTGLTDVVGKKVTDVIPGIRETDPEIFRIYGRVATSCQSERLEFYVEALKMWFSLSVYCPQKEYFVAVFDVITERKKAEQEIRRSVEELQKANTELERFNRAAVGREKRMIELKKEINELSTKAGGPERYRVDFEE